MHRVLSRKVTKSAFLPSENFMRDVDPIWRALESVAWFTCHTHKMLGVDPNLSTLSYYTEQAFFWLVTDIKELMINSSDIDTINSILSIPYYY